MKDKDWIIALFVTMFIAATTIGRVANVKLHHHAEALTAQRDSIAEIHTRSMVEWAALQRAMQTQVARATKAWADGARDFDTVFEAGMAFGAYLERYTYDMSNGTEHWGMETAP